MVAESLNVFSSQRPIRIVDFYDHIFDKFQLTDIEKIFKIHFFKHCLSTIPLSVALNPTVMPYKMPTIPRKYKAHLICRQNSW